MKASLKSPVKTWQAPVNPKTTQQPTQGTRARVLNDIPVAALEESGLRAKNSGDFCSSVNQQGCTQHPYIKYANLGTPSPPALTQVAEVTTTPADRSAEALSLAVALETSGLVHFVVRRAAEGDNAVASRDHTIVYKGTREINGTSSPSSPPPPPPPPPPQLSQGGGAVGVLETVEGLEPNATYEVRRGGQHAVLSSVWLQSLRSKLFDFNTNACRRKAGA